MFETPTSTSPPASAQSLSGTASVARFPLEHMAEFHEMQASAPGESLIVAAMASGVLFHVLLISERQLLRLEPSMFAWRGGPVTLGLLALVLLPVVPRHRSSSRALLTLLAWGMVAALTMQVYFAGAAQLFSIEFGIALLILVLGWTARLPLGWALLMSVGAVVTNALTLLSSPAQLATPLEASLAVAPPSEAALLVFKAQSLWAPIFAASLAGVIAWVRREEARRDFLATRQAAFAGVAPPVEEQAEARHLDPVTGVANRAAFDMRLRAAWDHAASRRHSVALLFFSIDDFVMNKRTHGQKFADQLQLQVANMLKEGLRRSDDMVARYDVQHFVVMLPGVGTDGATQIAERLRGCIEEIVVYLGPTRYRATVTVGVASLRARRTVPREKLIECAVHALDQGRQAGGNIVCVEGRGCLPRMV